MPPTSERPIKLDDRTFFSMPLAIIGGLLLGAATVGAVWANQKSEQAETKQKVADHEIRIQHFEAKLEDLGTIKNDVAWIKGILERREQAERR